MDAAGGGRTARHTGGTNAGAASNGAQTSRLPPTWRPGGGASGSGSGSGSGGAATARVLVHSASSVFSPTADSIRAFLARHDNSGASGPSSAPHRPMGVAGVAAAPPAASRSTWAAALVPVNRRRDKEMAAHTDRAQRALRKEMESERRKQMDANTTAAAGASAAVPAASAASSAIAGASTAATAVSSDSAMTSPSRSHAHSHAPHPSESMNSRRRSKAKPRSRQTVILVSADDEWQTELDLDLACTSSAIRSMLHAGRFVESVEGRISFPTIRKPMLQEVVAFLASQSSSHEFRPFGGDANPAVPALVELLMTAHFLDLPALMHACARSLSQRFLELPSLRHFPDEVLQLLVQHLPAQMLYVAERKLWKQHRHLPTRQAWHALFERKFRTAAPSTKVARLMCIQQFIESLMSQFTSPASSVATAPALPQAAPSSLHSSPNSLALLSPRHAVSAPSWSADAGPPSSTSSCDDRVSTAATAAALLPLRNWVSFLGPELGALQVRNAALEAHLPDLLPWCLPRLHLLDLAAGGYEKALGGFLARGLRTGSNGAGAAGGGPGGSHLPITGLDLARCGMGAEGLRAVCALICEQYASYTKHRARADSPERERSSRVHDRAATAAASSVSAAAASAPPLPKIPSRRATSLSKSSNGSASPDASDSASSSPRTSASSSPSPSASPIASSSLPLPQSQPQPLSLPAIASAIVPPSSEGEYHLAPFQPLSQPSSRSFHLSLPSHNAAGAAAAATAATAAPSLPSARQSHSSASSFVSHLHRSISSAALQHFAPLDAPSATADLHRTPRSHRSGAAASAPASSSNGSNGVTDAHVSAFEYADSTFHNGSGSGSDAPSNAELRRQRRRAQTLAAESAALLQPYVDGSSAGLEISLRDNMLGDACIAAFASGIQLGHLRCTHSTARQGMHVVRRVRPGWIRALDVSGNALGERGAAVLNVGACCLGSRGVATLVDGLSCASSPLLQLLDIRANIKPAEENHATSSLLHWLSSDASSTLTQLHLCSNAFPAIGLVGVLAGLVRGVSLRVLDLSGIDMSAPQHPLPAALALAVADMPQLRTLSLAGNRMACAATAHFAELLSNNATLTSLDLGGNQLDAYTAAAFGAALATNSALTALSLAGYTDGKRMRAEGCVALMRGLMHNRTLVSLDLSYHGIRNAGCLALCDVMQQPQCGLRFLCLQKNHIQHRGAMQIAICLQTLLSASTSWFASTSSQASLVLDLSCNAIDSHAQAALHACVQQAALIATNALRKQQAQEQTHHRAQAPSSDSAKPPSDARDGQHKAAPGSTSSRYPRAGSAAGAGCFAVRPPSLFEHAAGASQSVWASPHLRPPAFASHLAPHVARQLQRAGCTPLPTQVLQILCAHQSSTDADEAPATSSSANVLVG